MRFCAFRCAPARPLRGSCVSERSRCAFLRIVQLASHTLCGDRACRSAPAVRFCALYNLLRTPSAGIVRVGALPLCVFAYFQAWSWETAPKTRGGRGGWGGGGKRLPERVVPPTRRLPKPNWLFSLARVEGREGGGRLGGGRKQLPKRVLPPA